MLNIAIHVIQKEKKRKENQRKGLPLKITRFDIDMEGGEKRITFNIALINSFLVKVVTAIPAVVSTQLIMGTLFSNNTSHEHEKACKKGRRIILIMKSYL